MLGYYLERFADFSFRIDWSNSLWDQLVIGFVSAKDFLYSSAEGIPMSLISIIN